MIKLENIMTPTELNDYLCKEGFINSDYNLKVINSLMKLNTKDNYANPCRFCGANHTKYDNIHITKRDVENLDMLINEFDGTLLLKNINVSSNKTYSNKRSFFTLVYFGLAERIYEPNEDAISEEDDDLRQRYIVTDLGRKFAKGEVSIPAFCAQQDNIIVDRSYNYTVTREEVFENKFCMRDVVECNNKVGVPYIPFDKRTLNDHGHIEYTTSYATLHSIEMLLNMLKEKGSIKEIDLQKAMESSYNKTNTRDVIYGLIDKGYYVGYYREEGKFYLLKEIVDIPACGIHETYEKAQVRRPLVKEFIKHNIIRKTINTFEITKMEDGTFRYNKIYKDKIFTPYKEN